VDHLNDSVCRPVVNVRKRLSSSLTLWHNRQQFW
jgi:hypothetical protein